MYRKLILCLHIACAIIFISTSDLMPDFSHAFYPSPNFDERTQPIKTIIIHSTECPSTESALNILTSPKHKVSCHYLICQTGMIYHLVDDEKRAWHAGVSAWEDDQDINHSSIGIELDHVSPEEGSEEYPKVQINSLIELLKFLVQKHDIKSHNILAHSDIAPHRKRDPGNDFPWEILAKHNLGCWVPFPKKGEVQQEEMIDEEQAKEWLQQMGYRMGEFKHKILAFQRHFLRKSVSGELNLKTYQRLKIITKEMVARRQD